MFLQVLIKSWFYISLQSLLWIFFNPKICVMPINSDLLDELVDSQLLAGIVVDVDFWSDFVTMTGQLIHRQIQYS